MANTGGNAPGEFDEMWFRARVTQLQLAALAARCNADAAVIELPELAHWRTISSGKLCDLQQVRRWLINGWSTEHLLGVTARTLDGDALRNALHWAFPQAYYSVFAVCMAYFQAAGYTESTHAAVIRKFGVLASTGKYPPSLGFVAFGARPVTFAGLVSTDPGPSLQHIPNDKGVIDGRIAQTLRATRRFDLEARKAKGGVRTKNGTAKKSLTRADWEALGVSLGPTSLFSYLYRKRLKANYQDIDSYLHAELDPRAALRDLRSVVHTVNLVHEALILRALGEQQLRICVASEAIQRMDFLQRRHALLAGLGEPAEPPTGGR